MTSPFRFDGRFNPETEEERRKRLLREAMQASRLGVPFAPQPSLSSRVFADAAQQEADITAAFESALAEQRRRRESPLARLAGQEVEAPVADVLPPRPKPRPQPTIEGRPEIDQRGPLANQYAAGVSGITQMGLETGARLAKTLDALLPESLESGAAPTLERLAQQVKRRMAPPAPMPQALEEMSPRTRARTMAQYEKRQQEYESGVLGAQIAGEFLKYGGVTKLAQGIPAIARALGPRVTAVAAPTALGAVEDIGTKPELSLPSLLAQGARATGFEGAAQTLERQAETPYGRAAVGGLVGLIPDVGIESFSRLMQRGRGAVRPTAKMPEKAKTLLTTTARTAAGGAVGAAVGDTPEERVAFGLAGATGAAVAPSLVRRLVRPAEVPITDATTKRLLAAWERANPKVEGLAAEFMGGEVPRPLARATTLDRPFTKRIADWYDSAVSDPTNPEVQAAYRAFADETRKQYEFLRSKGITFEFVDTDPYKNSAEMMRDVADNNRLKVLKTQAGMHPLLTEEENDMFRAVHDFFGHAKEGHQFGQLGEENAYRVHSAMYSPEARRVMATETRGQNSWVNNQPANLKKPGSVYAEQKVALMPDEFLGEYPIERVTPEVVTNVEVKSDAMPGFKNEEFKALSDINRRLGRAAFIRKVVEPIVKSENLPVTVAKGLGSWLAEGDPGITEAARLIFAQMSPMAIQRVLSRVSQAAKQAGAFFAVPNPSGPRVSLTLDFGKTLKEPEYRNAIERLSAADNGRLFEGTTMVKLDPAKVQIVLKEGLDEQGAESLLNLARQVFPQYNTSGTVQRVEAFQPGSLDNLDEAFADYFRRIGYLTPEQAQAQQRAVTAYEQLAQAGPVRRALVAGAPALAEAARDIGVAGLRRAAEMASRPAALAAGRGGVGAVTGLVLTPTEAGAQGQGQGEGGGVGLPAVLAAAAAGGPAALRGRGAAVRAGLRQAATSPAISAAIGAGVGALTDEEDRFGGAAVGALAGAGLAGATVGTRQLLQARRALRSEGLPTALDKAYAIAKGGIDFTGAAGKQIAKRAKLGFQDSLKRMVDGMYRFAELDVLARDTGIRPTQSVESAVNTALGSQVTAARALEEGRGVEAGGIIDPDTQEIVAPSLQRVFEVLGGSPLKNEQGMTYAVALRRVGRYERAQAQARQWDKLADDAARDAEANLLTPEQAAAEQQAIATYREQVEAARKAGQPFPATIPTPTTARPEVGVDEPALAERLRLIGEAEATAALGPRPNPNQVYGNKPDAQAKLEADRAYIAGVGQKPEFVQFAEMLRQYTDGLANYAVKTGLWTPEMAKAFRDSDALYVPFKRLIESTTQKPRGPVRGGVTPGTVTPGVQQFRGSDLMLGNPAEALAEYTVALIQRADAYRVGAATIETVEALGERGAGILTKIDGTDPIAKAAAVDEAERAYRAIGMDESEAETMADVFARLSTKNDVIWRNGPEGREYYLVNDKTLVNALTTLNVQDGDAVRALLAIFGPMKRLATAFLTGNNPAFLLGTNLPRDLQMGTLQTTGIRPGDIAAGMVESIKSIFGRSAEVEALSRAGAGVVSQYGGGDISAAGVARRIAPITAGQQAMATAGRYVGAPLREIERIGRASEMPMRIAASRVARRQAAAAGLSEADQMALASRKFAEATVDFRRRSGYALDRLAEGSVPFYGAAKKGLAQFIKVSGRNPKRVGAALGLIGLAVVMEDISLGEGEERVEALDRPAYERAKYLRIGDTKIALPQELAAFAAAYRVGLAQLREDDPYVYEQFKQAVMNLTPPILGDVIRGKFVPIPVVGQLEELAANRSAFTGRPIVSEAMQRRMPSERRYETTAPTFDVLAAAARKIPGLEQASPIQAEFLLRGLTGGFTPAVTAVTDIPAQLLAGEAARERVPLPFMRQPLNPLAAVRIQPTRASESEREYYALRDKYQQARGTVNNFTTQYERAQAANDTDALNRLSAREQVLLRDPVYRRARADVDAGKGAPSALTVDSELQGILDVLQADIDRTNADFANGRITSRRARQLIDHYNKERQMRMREAAKLMRQNVPSGRQ